MFTKLIPYLGNCVQQSVAPPPDIVIVDTQQLLYHIVWPHGGTVSIVAESIKRRLCYYQVGTEKILVFDKYDDQTAKDHERMRRAGEGATEYNLTASSELPKRDAVLKNKHNKREFSRVFISFNFGDDISMESRVDAVFAHDEADITMVAYTLQAAKSGKMVIRVLSDDTDVFVLLVCSGYGGCSCTALVVSRWSAGMEQSPT